MTDITDARMRTLVWAAAAALLLVPLVAMRFTDEVRWDLADFTFAATLLALAAGGWDLATRTSHDRAWRAGAALALLAGFLLVWISLAVGIIGATTDPLNLLFAAPLAVAGVGAIAARRRGRGRGMALATLGAAAVQAAVAGIALLAGADAMPLLGATAMFTALWGGAAWLFARGA